MKHEHTTTRVCELGRYERAHKICPPSKDGSWRLIAVWSNTAFWEREKPKKPDGVFAHLSKPRQ